MSSRQDTQAGASAVLIASLMVMFLAIAAIAIDLSAGFNERNQDQNAGDNGVMAGAIDLADGLAGQVAVSSALDISAANLTAKFGSLTDPSWVEMWRTCQDDNSGWIAMPEPASWASVSTPSNPTPSGSETLDCVSRTTSLFRIRIPDQTVETAFGGVLGLDELQTHAVSIAKLELQSPVPPLIPFGLAGSITAGETCFGTSSTGTAYPPCSGPSSGTFGALLSEFFGDFYQVPGICANPSSSDAIEIGIALGLDHELEAWPGAAGVPVPTAEPGTSKQDVLNDPTMHLDQCDLDQDGNATPVDGIPINTVVVDTGFPHAEMRDGLVSNLTWLGKKSRLQQGTGPTRNIVEVRNGGSETVWPLDNVGPWDYLIANGTGIIECQPGQYDTPSPTPPIPTTDKADMFDTCLEGYVIGAHTEDIFATTVDQSPRFVWSPQYTYELPTTGLSYQPIRRFRMSFIAGTFFNCNSSSCAVAFYPDEDFDSEMCDLNPSNLNCANLSLDQFSAWVFPDEAVPQIVQDRFYDAFDDLEPTLWQ